MFALKAICLIPGNPARGLDAHQGIVTLFDGETGVPTAILDASAVTEIRTAAVTASLRARSRARTRRRWRSSGPGVQARSHLEALLPVRPFDPRPGLRARPRLTLGRCSTTRPADASSAELTVAPSAELAVRGADVVVVATSATRAGARARVAGRRRARQRGRRQLPERARDRCRRPSPPRALFCDSRESLRNEAGEFLLAIERGRDRRARSTSAPSSARCWRALKPGRSRRRRADAVPLARPRGRGSRRGRARGRQTPALRDRDRGRAVIELAEIEAARERIAGVAVRTPLVRLHDEELAGAEIYLKLETLQPINSFKIRGATNAVRPAPESERAKRAGHRERRQHGPGRRLGRPRARAAGDDRGARARARGQARRDRAARRTGGQAPLRGLVERDRHQPASTASTGCSCTRCRTRA